jgi:hypothetical protein
VRRRREAEREKKMVKIMEDRDGDIGEDDIEDGMAEDAGRVAGDVPGGVEDGVEDGGGDADEDLLLKLDESTPEDDLEREMQYRKGNESYLNLARA